MGTGIFEATDPALGAQIDAETLLHDLLDGALQDPAWAGTALTGEMDVQVASDATRGQVVLYQCGQPVHVGFDVWRFTATISVLANDPVTAWRLASHLSSAVPSWTYGQGPVCSSRLTAGFHRSADIKENMPKASKEYTADILVEARAARGDANRKETPCP